ncbi:hypothetical protein COCCU_10420 [Corynebacterium occultum]|uniref:Uncharacterized protein n=1 Tax=Corynebacterium occultum TaxID=2675219 RepID=A0A6B8VV46_9CORY|nr:hypothetical protein [Corynebacterium occultum]QGU08003.1 hypothetical protein COCCU_10420 [Corynebacterium occultum]
MIYTEIEYRLDAEEDPQRRKRLEQFIIEVVRSLPLFPVEQAVEIALQTDQSLDIYSSANLQEVTQKAERMTIRPAGEWKLLGYTPQSGARPIHLEIPREGPVPGPAKTEAHYLFQDMHLEPSAAVLMGRNEQANALLSATHTWVRRLQKDFATEQVYRHLDENLVWHCRAKLGNLWKVGAVAAWSDQLGSASSRQRVNPSAVGRMPMSPQLNRHDAWYTFDINSSLGPDDIFAEICLCLASVLMGYSPQVWRNPYITPLRGPLRLLECEAASYLACGRLGAPHRKASTEFSRLHTDPVLELPAELDWGRVLRTAAEIEDLLRGDTTPVWMDAGATPRGE